MPSFRTERHKTLVDLLKYRRKKVVKLSLREVAAALPDWMAWSYTVVGKVERFQRDLSYSELFELAQVYGTTISDLDAEVTEIEKAKKKAARPKKRTR